MTLQDLYATLSEKQVEGLKKLDIGRVSNYIITKHDKRRKEKLQKLVDNAHLEQLDYVRDENGNKLIDERGNYYKDPKKSKKIGCLAGAANFIEHGVRQSFNTSTDRALRTVMAKGKDAGYFNNLKRGLYYDLPTKENGYTVLNDYYDAEAGTVESGLARRKSTYSENQAKKKGYNKTGYYNNGKYVGEEKRRKATKNEIAQVKSMMDTYEGPGYYYMENNSNGTKKLIKGTTKGDESIDSWEVNQVMKNQDSYDNYYGKKAGEIDLMSLMPQSYLLSGNAVNDYQVEYKNQPNGVIPSHTMVKVGEYWDEDAQKYVPLIYDYGKIKTSVHQLNHNGTFIPGDNTSTHTGIVEVHALKDENDLTPDIIRKYVELKVKENQNSLNNIKNQAKDVIASNNYFTKDQTYKEIVNDYLNGNEQEITDINTHYGIGDLQDKLAKRMLALGAKETKFGNKLGVDQWEELSGTEVALGGLNGTLKYAIGGNDALGIGYELKNKAKKAGNFKNYMEEQEWKKYNNEKQDIGTRLADFFLDIMPGSGQIKQILEQSRYEDKKLYDDKQEWEHELYVLEHINELSEKNYDLLSDEEKKKEFKNAYNKYKERVKKRVINYGVKSKNTDFVSDNTPSKGTFQVKDFDDYYLNMKGLKKGEDKKYVFKDDAESFTCAYSKMADEVSRIRKLDNTLTDDQVIDLATIAWNNYGKVYKKDEDGKVGLNNEFIDTYIKHTNNIGELSDNYLDVAKRFEEGIFNR